VRVLLKLIWFLSFSLIDNRTNVAATMVGERRGREIGALFYGGELDRWDSKITRYKTR
jgi:hypothetical protein